MASEVGDTLWACAAVLMKSFTSFLCDGEVKGLRGFVERAENLVKGDGIIFTMFIKGLLFLGSRAPLLVGCLVRYTVVLEIIEKLLPPIKLVVMNKLLKNKRLIPCGHAFK